MLGNCDTTARSIIFRDLFYLKLLIETKTKSLTREIASSIPRDKTLSLMFEQVSFVLEDDFNLKDFKRVGSIIS